MCDYIIFEIPSNSKAPQFSKNKLRVIQKS